jgi:hypothetical protein
LITLYVQGKKKMRNVATTERGPSRKADIKHPMPTTNAAAVAHQLGLKIIPVHIAPPTIVEASPKTTRKIRARMTAFGSGGSSDSEVFIRYR